MLGEGRRSFCYPGTLSGFDMFNYLKIEHTKRRRQEKEKESY